MSKQKTHKSSFHGKDFHTPKAATKITDHNLMSVSPLKEQFQPTEANPIRRRVKMAGG